MHLHGGERSGTIDEPVRHAITKLSHWHFVATAESRRRVISLGERAEHVWVTGAPSLDDVAELSDVSRERTLLRLGLHSHARYALLLFHPVVQDGDDAYRQTEAILAAINKTLIPEDIQVVWLDPNTDAGSNHILSALAAAEGTLHRITHLPRSDFLPALRHAEILIGNSSAGIIEAASLGTPVVNVGPRQRGRERNKNTYDCDSDTDAIVQAVSKALAGGRFEPGNRYGDGTAGRRIAALLAEQSIDPDLLHKMNTF